MTTASQKRGLFAATLALVILHTAGFFGILSPSADWFISLTPLNLLISASLLFYFHKEFNGAFFLFCAISLLTGYFIEVAGVKSKAIFGDYQYGPTLGPSLLGVPLIMGLNWLMLIYSIGCICEKIRAGILMKSLLGAMMLVVLDFFMEPVAVGANFWSWNSAEIPLQNYLAWYIVAAVLLFVFYRLTFNKDNALAKTLYIVQLVFFVLLSLFKY